MSDETPRGRTGHGASLVAWNRHAKPGIAPRRSDTGGRGNMADVHRDRLPLVRRVLANFFSPNGASRRPWRSRRPGLADTGMSVMRAALAGLALAALLPFGPAPAAADTGVRLDGPRIQGGLLRGQVPPGSVVEFQGRRGAGVEGRLVPGRFRAGSAAGKRSLWWSFPTAGASGRY